MSFGYVIKREGLADLFFFERDGAKAKLLLHFLQKIYSKSFFYNVNGTLFMRRACTERSRSVGEKRNVCGMDFKTYNPL